MFDIPLFNLSLQFTMITGLMAGLRRRVFSTASKFWRQRGWLQSQRRLL